MSFLELKSVEVYYDDVPAIRGVSLKIEKGELVSIIGANGAGKTTTLNTISGLLQPRPGEIWFEDKRIDTLPAHRVADRGIVQIPKVVASSPS